MNKEIPFHKVKKVIRFRFSEIETWINKGGGVCAELPVDEREGDLFTGAEAGEAAEAGADREAGETAAGSGTDGEIGSVGSVAKTGANGKTAGIEEVQA
jgi:hypothetical protein